MNRSKSARHWRRLSLILLTLFAAALTTMPTQARGRDTTGYSITLTSRNGTTFQYANVTSVMDGTLTYPAGSPTPTGAFYILLEGMKLADGASSHGNTIGVAARIPQLPVGDHSAVATYYDPSTGTTVQSPPLIISIVPANVAMSCGTLTQFAFPGQTVTVSMAFINAPAPVDWQDGTDTVTFTGPTTLTYPNLTPNGNDAVSVVVPSQVGMYQIRCDFSGTTDFAPTYGFGETTVSLQHALGTAQLYSDPTPIVAQQDFELYLVLHAAPGLPVPTGYLVFGLAGAYSNQLALRSDGTVLVAFHAPYSMEGVTQITVSYQGGPYYAPTDLTFPITNPAIPAGVLGTSPTSTPGSANQGTPSSAKATATPSPSATGTPDGGVALAASPTPNGGAVATSTLAGTHADDGGSPLPIVALLVFLLLAGGGAGFLIFRARRLRSVSRPN